jgi:phage shock protein C
MQKKLYLSDTDKKLFGVCGGLGEYFNLDSTIIRLLWVFLCIPTLFLGVLAYFIAAMVIPKRPWE